jgi:hypothetical protein
MENNYIPIYSDTSYDEEYIQEELLDKSKEWWNSYKFFNNCFITDILYGEICNCIECSSCGKSIFNFSTFNTLYVPIKKSSVSITINLILQYYNKQDDEINMVYYTLPFSLKASDPMKILDLRLRERFNWIQGDSFSPVSDDEFENFKKDFKITYLQRKEHEKRVEV